MSAFSCNDQVTSYRSTRIQTGTCRKRSSEAYDLKPTTHVASGEFPRSCHRSTNTVDRTLRPISTTPMLCNPRKTGEHPASSDPVKTIGSIPPWVGSQGPDAAGSQSKPLAAKNLRFAVAVECCSISRLDAFVQILVRSDDQRCHTIRARDLSVEILANTYPA